MKPFSKKKGGVGEVSLPKALVMSLFKDEDVKNAIKAFVPAAEVIKIESSAKETVTQTLSVPYVVPKRQVNMAAALLYSLNLPIKKKGGA
eukprot:14898010-Ditylum_brightwellii.AAC.1